MQEKYMCIKDIARRILQRKQHDESVPSVESLCLANAVQFGRFSFELEEKREQSLITQSGHMLTAIALYSAALLMLLPLVLDISVLSKAYLWGAVSAIFFPLVCGLVSTLLAQWRYRYETLVNAQEFYENFDTSSKEGYYNNQEDFDYQWIAQLTAAQKSKKKVNDIRLFFIRLAMICFLISILFLIISWSIIAIVVL